jgi:DNA mismatch repair protein MutL
VSEELPRIRTLPPHLADQIAAGEVVERPASVVRELVDNALDAGARRIEIQVEGGGADRIFVLDDGHGIHPEDLELSITRHATSKIRRAADLVEVATLGFRGEALASIAAVARLRIESRRRGAPMGHALDVGPGRPPRVTPVGMPPGTRIAIEDLFATLPARRKFLRSEATELGHLTETVLRAALVHPEVYFVVRTPGRTLLELMPAGEDARIEAVLARRGHGVVRRTGGEHDGTRVDAWVLAGDATPRAGQGLFVIVRRRVVRERHLSRILSEAVGEGLAPGQHPIACLRVEPGEGIVDVNVHPQKAEIRFADPQKIYADVRAVLEARRDAFVEPAPVIGLDAPRASVMGDVVARWAAHAEPARAVERVGGTSSPSAYRLRTHAVGGGYASHRELLREGAGILDRARRAADEGPTPQPHLDPEVPVERDEGPLYLGCLPGPVGLFRVQDDLLAVDLRALRSHLLHLRLREDLGGSGALAQALLQPAVVSLPAADVASVREGAGDLSRLGLVLEAFGDEAVLVRAVPATLRGCIEEPDAADLVARVLPWLRVRGRAPDLSPVAAALAQTGGADPAPRLARRWLAEVLERGESLSRVPGVRRWTAADLVGKADDDR